MTAIHRALRPDPLRDRLLAGGPGARELFPGGSLASEADVKARAAALEPRRNPGERAAALADLLAEGLAGSITSGQRRNLDATREGRALFVLTGQQPGLLGGPTLWLYKAHTCARLARRWEAALGVPVVPVFWIAGDDGDLREVNHVEMLEHPAGPESGFSLDFARPDAPIPVGERIIDPAALDAALDRHAPLWGPEIRAAIRRAYGAPGSAGAGFTAGFRNLAQAYLGREGMLFVDGHSPRLRALARPRMEELIRRRGEFEACLRTGGAALRAAGAEPRVRLREGVVHAFSLGPGGRERLFSSDGRMYTAEDPGRNLLDTGALAAAELSHDVLSRPLLADALFPALGHVLGPAELNYWAMLGPAFARLGGGAPALHPRMSASVISATDLKSLAAAGVGADEAPRLAPARLKARLRERHWREDGMDRKFPDAAPDGAWAALAAAHAAAFPDLPRALEGLRAAWDRDWGRYLASLRRRHYRSRAATDAPLYRSLRWLAQGQGQDRHLNVHSLAQALGPGGIEDLLGMLDPLDPAEQLVAYADA